MRAGGWAVVCALLSLGAGTGGAAEDAAAGARARLGWRAWYADNGLAGGLLWGPEAFVRCTRHVWGRMSYMAGKYRDPGDVETVGEWEGSVGVSLKYADVFAGYRHSEIETRLDEGWRWGWIWEEFERNGNIHGLILGVRSDVRVAGSPLSAGVEASAMPEDTGALTGVGYDAAHGDIGAALKWEWSRAALSAGYRLRRYRFMPPRNVNGAWFDRRRLHGPELVLTAEF